MKIHSDKITRSDIGEAVPSNCYLALWRDKDRNLVTIKAEGSRKRLHGYVMRLSGTSVYNAAGLSDKAATWDEWGNFIANLFKIDHAAIIGDYNGVDDFIAKTTEERDRLATYRPDVATTHTAPWLDDLDLVFLTARL